MEKVNDKKESFYAAMCESVDKLQEISDNAGTPNAIVTMTIAKQEDGTWDFKHAVNMSENFHDDNPDAILALFIGMFKDKRLAPRIGDALKYLNAQMRNA